MPETRQIAFELKARIAGEEITSRTEKDGPSYDERELEELIEKGTRAWADLPDSVAWVREQRGRTHV